MKREETSVVYMGTPDFAVASLDAVREAGYKISAVVTVPDKPAGRGLQLKESPVKVYAKKHDLKILQPEKLKDPSFLDDLNALQPDIIIVVAFRMLPKEVWSAARLGTFNLHGSLLPRYRGAAPVQWAIINGDEQSGVTTFLIDEKIDTGKILLRKKVTIEENDNAGSLHDKLMTTGAGLVVETCDLLREGKAEAKDQAGFSDVDEMPAPKIFRKDCLIDWNETLLKIHNRIRGLSPYPGAFTRLYSEEKEAGELKIFSAEMVAETPVHTPGTVIIREDENLLIAASDGYIVPKEVQLSGKKRMKMAELMRGLRIKEGDFSAL